MLGHKELLSTYPWPQWDDAKTVQREVTMAVQVGGKFRSTITLATDTSDDEVVAAALADEKVARFTEGKQLVKSIVVKNKLVNLIVK